MKSLVVLAAIMVALVMMPVMTAAQSDQAGTATSPPLSQPLVREGTLAAKLAEALKVGTPANETEAESALTAVGIAPKNGWIADYPVTPDIAGELQTSVVDAASAGRISLNKDAAAEAFQDVMMSHNLSVAPDISTPAEPAESEAYPPDYPDTEVINDYYYDEGPPVVTYYAPPPDYAYLYSWVPYPFWWWNVRFPGFFVLVDFDRGFHGHGHHGHGDREFISNHFRDRSTGRMARIDPAHRARGGKFAERGDIKGWTSPRARSGAQAIVENRSVFESARRNRVVSSVATSGISRSSPRGMPSVSTAGKGTVPRVAGTPAARTYGSSNLNSRRSFTQDTYRTPQTIMPSSGQGRTFSRPSHRIEGNYTRSMEGRSFSAPSAGGRSGSGSFGGMRGGSGRGGGSFGGGRR